MKAATEYNLIRPHCKKYCYLFCSGTSAKIPSGHHTNFPHTLLYDPASVAFIIASARPSSILHLAVDEWPAIPDGPSSSPGRHLMAICHAVPDTTSDGHDPAVIVTGQSVNVTGHDGNVTGHDGKLTD